MNTITLRLEEEKKEERRRKLISAFITAFIISGLLALLILFGFKYYNPPLEVGGVSVALGSPDAGFTDEISEQSAQQQAASTPNAEESLETQDYEDAPEENATPTPSTTPNNTSKTEKKEDKREVNSDFLFQKGNKNTNSGGGGNPGNQGAENGQGDDLLGQGSTGDGSWSLKGRNLKRAPGAKCTFPEEGTLTMKIEVNSSGRVIKADADYKHSTVTSSKNIECARNALKDYEFSEKEGMNSQFGTVVFNFKKK